MFNNVKLLFCYTVFNSSSEASLRPWNLVPGIRHPFTYLEKYPISLKRNWQKPPKFTQIPNALYHHRHKNTLNFHKSIPHPLNYLANILTSLKTLPVLHHLVLYAFFYWRSQWIITDWKHWPRGYKTFFVLNSTEHEISTDHKN